MTEVKKPNQITPTENKNGAEDMSRKVSFKRKKSKILNGRGSKWTIQCNKPVHSIFNKGGSNDKISGH